jgi:hypothetical protein
MVLEGEFSWYSSQEARESALNDLLSLGAVARNILSEAVENQGITRSKLSKACTSLEDNGFIFIRELNNFFFDHSYLITPSLFGEEAGEHSMKWAYGSARRVLLTKKWAFKFPNWETWQLFLCGLLANQEEAIWGRMGQAGVCPVRFSIPGGFLVVMPKCSPIPEAWQWSVEEWEEFKTRKGYRINCECKGDSVGLLNGEVVAVDYGTVAVYGR